MSTSSRPRRAGARASAAVLAALTATGATLITAPVAVAAPGDNGDVVIHRVGFPYSNERNQARVCDFYLAAFDFDTIRKVNWRIDNQPPTTGADPVAEGSISLSGGSGFTPPVMAESARRYQPLPNGQYRLTWVIDQTPTVDTDDTVPLGTGEERVFRVACPPVGPNGGPPAGGGGLAMTQNFTPVAGTAAVGLAAVGGVACLRLRRRRTDGAA
ncbi:hypothetical protein [Streptomyces ipomoeae]|uniref:hypothetical protein n=1 Tax=Streptomyces ipomoeae TaxID=103232 RepID=UPI0011479C85|nr:hypothetical protein [Streptomyces ipomoeae]MDX2936350.1 hypothetical protein [Streptomyces ipomoeae]TQE26324.1 hypothetical protein SipoB123_14200 [Streptomyces ipomoeae]